MTPPPTGLVTVELVGEGSGEAASAVGVVVVEVIKRSSACVEVTKCTIRLSLPLALLNRDFFSSGKSILLKAFGSFSFDMIIRL